MCGEVDEEGGIVGPAGAYYIGQHLRLKCCKKRVGLLPCRAQCRAMEVWVRKISVISRGVERCEVEAKQCAFVWVGGCLSRATSRVRTVHASSPIVRRRGFLSLSAPRGFGGYRDDGVESTVFAEGVALTYIDSHASWQLLISHRLFQLKVALRRATTTCECESTPDRGVITLPCAVQVHKGTRFHAQPTVSSGAESYSLGLYMFSRERTKRARDPGHQESDL
ncbi:hypothetical protein BKA62DRAFT_178328 [Auriculariales sp. MPI-PUGE-AT-0066]|nr:hypothetical protein BKA62DRAFT_178328 [Auriculariales sp. MPI-PUGE-AT-0066]